MTPVYGSGQAINSNWASRHFSVIDGSGYRELAPGEVLDFDYKPAHQDSFR